MNWQFSNDAPIYAQLIRQIRAGIVSGATQTLSAKYGQWPESVTTNVRSSGADTARFSAPSPARTRS